MGLIEWNLCSSWDLFRQFETVFRHTLSEKMRSLNQETPEIDSSSTCCEPITAIVSEFMWIIEWKREEGIWVSPLLLHQLLQTEQQILCWPIWKRSSLLDQTGFVVSQHFSFLLFEAMLYFEVNCKLNQHLDYGTKVFFETVSFSAGKLSIEMNWTIRW